MKCYVGMQTISGCIVKLGLMHDLEPEECAIANLHFIKEFFTSNVLKIIKGI